MYRIACVLITIISTTSIFAQTTYYSRNGATLPRNWNETDSWTLNSDGSGSAAGVPGRNDNITILNGHTIIISSTSDNGSTGVSPDALGRPNVGAFPASSDPFFYHTGDISINQGGGLSSSVKLLIEGYTQVFGTLNISDDIANIGKLEVQSSATFSSSNDFILSGNSETLIYNATTATNDIHIDHTDALLCGTGSIGIGGDITFFNSATLDQVCSNMTITGCATCPTSGTGNTQLPINHILVQQGSSWRYLDDGSDQGTSWTGASFDDSSWTSGNAQLGYGDGDEATVVSFGADPNDKHETTYFRKSFSVADASIFHSLIVNILRDDGAVVYINGVEVIRDNMPSGTISYTTLASSAVGGSAESIYNSYSISSTNLVNGTNYIAVEIHQRTLTSTDLSFDLELIGIYGDALINTGETWQYLDDGSDQGTAWTGTSFDDSGWASGNAQLGYGDGDEATVVSFGVDPNDKHETTYFRKSFSVPDASIFHSLIVNILRDDGAVIYINGTEVVRDNMPSGVISYTTLASSRVGGVTENNYSSYSVSNTHLVNGTNYIAVEIHQDDITSSDLSFDLQLIGIYGNALINRGEAWQYLDDGSDQGTAWTSTSFDDSGWASGNAQLGYGDGDEATIVSFGADPNDKHETTYFRKSFSVPNTSLFNSLSINMLRDDGVVVYINGIEVLRDNMPSGTISYTTLASSRLEGSIEDVYNSYSISSSSLVNGTNYIAVEIHQSSITSTDISFDLELAIIEPNVLPISLSQFEGVVIGNTVKLNWATTSEINNDYFVIQRSKEGYNFENIGIVNGVGTSYQTVSYNFIDKNPTLGNNYYRLLQVDFDGKSSRSELIYLYFNKNLLTYKIYPNPAQDIINIRLPNHMEDAKVTLLTTNGVRLFESQTTTNKTYSIDVSHLKPGVYFLQIQYNGRISSQKVVITSK